MAFYFPNESVANRCNDLGGFQVATALGSRNDAPSIEAINIISVLYFFPTQEYAKSSAVS